MAASGHNGTGKCTRPFSVPKLIVLLLLIAAFFILAKFLNMVPLFMALGVMAVITFFIIYLVMFITEFSAQKSEEQKSPPPKQ
ncbi:MAG: hypothetical protein J6X33_06565 [Clostridiales bacterium]|nr:hypothetical protein [Clostridiales bacterium]